MASSIHWGLRILLLLLIVDLFYVAAYWPDWSTMTKGAVPKSKFIEAYQEKQRRTKGLPALRWRPVQLEKIPEDMQRAVIVGEDSRFYFHDGFDLIAFREAMDYNIDEGKMVLGGSTISQQTVKNLFLSPSRTPLRKWHELLITWGMEHSLSKKRILELYLNIAEFGQGVYGVEAAARHYWNKPIGRLSRKQIAGLAACLPSPKKHNPTTQTKFFERRVAKILHWLNQSKG